MTVRPSVEVTLQGKVLHVLQPLAPVSDALNTDVRVVTGNIAVDTPCYTVCCLYISNKLI